MFGRRGQGALEYLMILAGVIAIAVVVIFVINSVSTPAKNSAIASSDKYACAQAGILLPDDYTGYDGGSIKITYNGGSMTCTSGSINNPSAKCTIHKGSTAYTLAVNGTNCGITLK